MIEQGPVRAVIESCYRYSESLFFQRVIVYADLARVEFETEVHWFERGGSQKDAAMFTGGFSAARTAGQIYL